MVRRVAEAKNALHYVKLASGYRPGARRALSVRSARFPDLLPIVSARRDGLTAYGHRLKLAWRSLAVIDHSYNKPRYQDARHSPSTAAALTYLQRTVAES